MLGPKHQKWTWQAACGTADIRHILGRDRFGTVTHMSPELLTEGHLSKDADVYSFGVMLWEMCAPAPPSPPQLWPGPDAARGLSCLPQCQPEVDEAPLGAQSDNRPLILEGHNLARRSVLRDEDGCHT